MENQEINNKPQSNLSKYIGLAIVVFGFLLLAGQLGMYSVSWSTIWPAALIIIGLINYFKFDKKKPGWLIPVLIGLLFLIERIFPDFSVSNITWPAIIIGIGLWMLFGRRTNKSQYGDGSKFEKKYSSFNDGYSDNDKSFDGYEANSVNNDDYISTVAVFGGAKTNVLTKTFKGGDITSIFGGTEINFSHADIEGVVIIEATQVFGGTKIIVPPTWDVTSEISAIFGGIDDNRSLTQVLPDRSKVLVLRGTSVFGGIEIRNF